MSSDLLGLCEPLFQYVCRLNRSARPDPSGDPHQPRRNVDFHQTRREVGDLLADFRAKASADPVLVSVADEVELVLTFFADGMIASSQLNIAAEWHVARLAYDWRGGPEMNGDEKLFEMLERALKDRSDVGTQKVAVYYTCLGLGFRGWYAGDPAFLRRKMLECSHRVRGLMDADPRSLICPDAYQTDTRNLIQKPTGSLVGISLALVGLTAVLLAAYYFEYRSKSKDLNDAFDRVITAPQSSAATAIRNEGGVA